MALAHDYHVPWLPIIVTALAAVGVEVFVFLAVCELFDCDLFDS